MHLIKALTRVTTSQEWSFKKQWRSPVYYVGDIYQDDIQNREREKWKVENPDPYLQFLTTISSEWPQIRLLADFMEVGTDPLRWRNFHDDDKHNIYTYPDNPNDRKIPQLDRVNRTQVRQLIYFTNHKADCADCAEPGIERTKAGCKSAKHGVECAGSYTNPSELSNALASLQNDTNMKSSCGNRIRLRLFVVEDLSREVIEKLGYHFDIDPDFFRAHIFDHVWFNIRDPWSDPPSLYADIEQRSWFQFRFCRARYFSSQSLFTTAQEAANKFNVGRKLYEDENKAIWDTESPQEPAQLKGLSFWSKRNAPDEEVAVNQPRDVATDRGTQVPKRKRVDGKVGLMRSKATYWRRKGEGGDCDVGVLLLDPTIKEGFPLWRGHRNWHRKPSSKGDGVPDNLHSPNLERSSPGWNTPPKKTFFEDYMHWAQSPEPVLGYRSATAADSDLVPIIALLRLVCSEWLTLIEYIKARLTQVDWEITHPDDFLVQRQIDSILNKLHTWRRLVPVYKTMLADTKSFLPFLVTSDGTDPSARSPLHAYDREITLALEQMEEFDKRIDRLTTVVTSAISLVDSRRVQRLTVLASLFVPLSLVGTLFSMSGDVREIGATFGYWAALSFFLLAVQIAWILHTSSRYSSKRKKS